MIKKLSGVIGRKKRIDRKMTYLKQLIGKSGGREKIDFALEVSESVMLAKNNRELEKLADSYIARIEKFLQNR